jgi:hypothetical protein
MDFIEKPGVKFKNGAIGNFKNDHGQINYKLLVFRIFSPKFICYELI